MTTNHFIQKKKSIQLSHIYKSGQQFSVVAFSIILFSYSFHSVSKLKLFQFSQFHLFCSFCSLNYFIIIFCGGFISTLRAFYNKLNRKNIIYNYIITSTFQCSTIFPLLLLFFSNHGQFCFCCCLYIWQYILCSVGVEQFPSCLPFFHIQIHHHPPQRTI